MDLTFILNLKGKGRWASKLSQSTQGSPRWLRDLPRSCGPWSKGVAQHPCSYRAAAIKFKNET